MVRDNRLTTLAILAGGSSRRLGQNKSLAQLEGTGLLQRVLNRLSLLNLPLLIVTSRDQYPYIADLCLNQRLVIDLYPGKGVLGGIFTALLNATTGRVFITGCDMPFLNTKVIDYLISVADDYDATVPNINGLNEPLHAVYCKDCLATAGRLLQAGRLATPELLNRVKTKYIRENEIDRFDPGHLSFFNINMGADLDRARSIARHLTAPAAREFAWR